jgi:hypothetical protein
MKFGGAAGDCIALSEKLWDVTRHLVGELLDSPNRPLPAMQKKFSPGRHFKLGLVFHGVTNLRRFF